MTFRKEDLVPGKHLIKFRLNSALHLVLLDETDKIVFNDIDSGWMPLDKYNDTLEHLVNSDWDITEVRKFGKGYTAYRKRWETETILVWDRHAEEREALVEEGEISVGDKYRSDIYKISKVDNDHIRVGCKVVPQVMISNILVKQLSGLFLTELSDTYLCLHTIHDEPSVLKECTYGNHEYRMRITYFRSNVNVKVYDRLDTLIFHIEANASLLAKLVKLINS